MSIKTNPNYNKKLRQKMNERAMDIKDLAKVCGVSTRTVMNMLMGGHIPTAKNVRKVCAIFGCMPLQVGLCAEPKEDTI